MLPIDQRSLFKRSNEEVPSCSLRISPRSMGIFSYILGSISGILMTLIIMKFVQYDELLLQTTRPAMIEISLPTKQAATIDLAQEVRVLCFVLTHPINHLTKAKAVANTWGKRCNKVVFISTSSADDFDVITVNVTEEHRYLWGKTKQGLQQIYELYGNDFDWFLKTDDDTWIFMENLRHFLYAYSPSYPIYFGCKLKPFVKQGYMSGSAYVMSREALRRFNEDALTDDYKCWNGTEGNEDVEVGKCLQSVGVLAGDSRDSQQRARFLPFTPEGHLRNLFGVSWLDNSTYYEIKKGFDCCSDSVISFHYIHFNQMYVFDFLGYRMRLYGNLIDGRLPRKLSLDEIKQQLLAYKATSTTKSYAENMSSSNVSDASIT